MWEISCGSLLGTMLSTELTAHEGWHGTCLQYVEPIVRSSNSFPPSQSYPELLHEAVEYVAPVLESYRPTPPQSHLVLCVDTTLGRQDLQVGLWEGRGEGHSHLVLCVDTTLGGEDLQVGLEGEPCKRGGEGGKGAVHDGPAPCPTPLPPSWRLQ